jgi:uncharacterized protein YbjQ (UPF0145 family)
MSDLSWKLSVLGALLACACAGLAEPREALGPPEFVQRTKPEPSCDHVVELVQSGATDRPYDEVSRISVTCHPSAQEICERRLRARACTLGADAVLLMPPDSEGTGKPPYSQSQIAQSGVAVRYR